jgi:hypothetical protein
VDHSGFQSGTNLLYKYALKQRRDSIKVKSSPQSNLCIFMSDFRRRSTITSVPRVSGDCQHQPEENNAATIQESTHSAMANSVNHQQVIVMNKYFIAIKCLLHD